MGFNNQFRIHQPHNEAYKRKIYDNINKGTDKTRVSDIDGQYKTPTNDKIQKEVNRIIAKSYIVIALSFRTFSEVSWDDSKASKAIPIQFPIDR